MDKIEIFIVFNNNLQIKQCNLRPNYATIVTKYVFFQMHRIVLVWDRWVDGEYLAKNEM